MKRRWLEKIKNSSNEELLTTIWRGGAVGIEAAKEIIRRRREGMTIPKECFRASLGLRVKGPSQVKAVEELKAKVVEILTGGVLDLDKEDLLIILREIKSQEIRERVVRRYQTVNKEFDELILMEIIRKVPSLVEEFGWKLLKKTNSPRVLQVIEEEAEGPLQLAAFEKHGKRGRSLDDACYNIGFIPALAKLTWEELRQKRKIEKLSLEHLNEIVQYTDSQEIREEARKIALKKAKEKGRRLREKIQANPKDIEAQIELQKLNELIDKLEEGEVKKSFLKKEEILISTALKT